jgi:hypothetical protein
MVLRVGDVLKNVIRTTSVKRAIRKRKGDSVEDPSLFEIAIFSNFRRDIQANDGAPRGKESSCAIRRASAYFENSLARRNELSNQRMK